MHSPLVRIASVVMAALALGACRDDSRTLLAPKASDKMLLIDKPYFPRPMLPDPNDFAEITAGNYHTCARKNNGNVYCWGKVGGPNIPTASKVFQPTLVGSGATRITAGFDHTCMLDANGLASCWGSDEVGQGGQGNGLSTTLWGGPVSAPIPSPGVTQTTPLSYRAIAAGGYSTCGVTATELFCWGQLGDIKNPSPTWTGAPMKIADYNGTGPQLTLGRRHACIALSSFVQAFCWGADNLGQAGVDPFKGMFYPGTSALIFAQENELGATVLRVSAHEDFTCADLTDGTVACFGDESSSQLGEFGLPGGFTFHPHKPGNGQQLRGVSAGYQHACALDPSGNAWCWGSNSWGQLGTGILPWSASSLVNPMQVQFPAGTTPVTFRAIAAGKNHTCAIGTDNHIYCWGQLDFGQLGIGPITPSGFWPTAQRAIDPAS